MAIYNALIQHIPENNIIISCHPKVQYYMENTHLAPRIWHGPISEVLEKGKLLITDYSSVCYNTFYQGGGVIFYHEDIKLYEEYNGPLIPSVDEYIGERVFSIRDLQTLLSKGIRKGSIILNKFRTPEHEARYQTINEFHDGQNIIRIYQALKDRGIID